MKLVVRVTVSLLGHRVGNESDTSPIVSWSG